MQPTHGAARLALAYNGERLVSGTILFVAGTACPCSRSRDLDSLLLRCYERDAVSTPCARESDAQT